MKLVPAARTKNSGITSTIYTKTTRPDATARLFFEKNKADTATTEEETTTKPTDAAGNAVYDPGFRFDPNFQRWVKAPRLAGKSNTTITPLSGPAFTAWPVMHYFLTEKKLKSVDKSEAIKLMKKGAALVDVRLSGDFDIEHAEGAVNVPLYRLTAGDAKFDKVKRVIMNYVLFMKSTESNPDFLSQAAAVLGKNKRKKVIVMCAAGGTLDTVTRNDVTGKTCKDDKERAFGRETRSLKGCYTLMMGGYTDVVHLKGGLGEWRYDGYPLAGTAHKDK
jgi:rhodanese-related sulfurtransferase